MKRALADDRSHHARDAARRGLHRGVQPALRLLHRRRGAYRPAAGADGGAGRVHRHGDRSAQRLRERAERFPGVTLSTEWPDEALKRLKPDRRTAVVTLTHDPKLDDPALGRGAALGRVLYRRARLQADPCRRGSGGWREWVSRQSDFARIHGPVGLESARCRRPRSRFRSLARDDARCCTPTGGRKRPRAGKRPPRPHEIRRDAARRGRRRDPGHSLKVGDARAQEGPGARREADIAALKAAGLRAASWRRGSNRATSARTRRPTGWRRHLAGRQCPRPARPSPAAPICLPRRPASALSTATRSTGFNARRRGDHARRRCRPDAVVAGRGRWSRRSRSSRLPCRRRGVSACLAAIGARRKIAARRALPAEPRGADPDPAARPQGQHSRQDAWP